MVVVVVVGGEGGGGGGGGGGKERGNPLFVFSPEGLLYVLLFKKIKNFPFSISKNVLTRQADWRQIFCKF